MSLSLGQLGPWLPLALVGLAAALFLGVVGLNLRLVLRLRFTEGAARLAQEDEVPLALRQDLAPTLAIWEGLGFQPQGWLHQVAPFVGQHQGHWVALLTHPEGPTHALVQAALFPTAGQSTHSALITVRADGERLESNTAQVVSLVFGRYPHTHFAVRTQAEPAAQLQEHRQAAQSFLGTQAAQSLSLEAWVAQSDQELRAYGPSLEADELAKHVGPKLWRARFEPALAFTWRLMTTRHPKPQSPPPGALRGDGGVGTEVAAYLRTEGLQAQGPGPQGHLLALGLGGGLLLMLALLPLKPGATPEYLTMLALAVAVHDVGHLLAMKAFGHHDASLLLVRGLAPYLGKPVQAKPTRRLGVLLLGPLPGLLLGLACLAWWMPLPNPHPTLLRDLFSSLIGLHFLKLLPISPLNGGRLMEALLQPLGPWARWAFRSLLLLGAVALLVQVDDLGFMGLVCALLLAGVVVGWWRQRRLDWLMDHVAPNHPSQAEHLEAVFLALRQAPFKPLPFPTQHHLVRQLLAQGPPLDLAWGWRLLWAIAYAGVLVGSVCAFLSILLGKKFGLF